MSPTSKYCLQFAFPEAAHASHAAAAAAHAAATPAAPAASSSMLLSLAHEASQQIQKPPAPGAPLGPSPAPPQSFRIYIHVPLKDKSFSGCVKPSTKISTLKSAVCAREGLTPNETCFFFAGKEVDIEKKACDLNMKHNDVLVVLGRAFLNPTRESLKKGALEKIASARLSARHAAKLSAQPAQQDARSPERPIEAVADNVTCFFNVFNQMVVMESSGLARPTAQVKRRFLEALGDHQPVARTGGEHFFENLMKFVIFEWTSFPRAPEPDRSKWTLTDILDQIRMFSKTQSAPEHTDGPPPSKRMKL
jgi:hypothetical protein